MTDDPMIQQFRDFAMQRAGYLMSPEELQLAVDFARQEVLTERERCAKVCEDRAAWEDWNPAQSLREVAAEIRGEAIREG
jgi:hypothetical protein